MKTITLREATDKQIIDYIYDDPRVWEIQDFIGNDYNYEVVRGEEELKITLFDVWYVEEDECEVSPQSPRDFCFYFPADMLIEVEDDRDEYDE